MKYLKHMAVVKYENLLIQHLSLGGNVRDLTGKNLVGQQILAVWNKEGIRDICAAQGITMDNFCDVYSACIECLMPNPCINGGGGVIMLVPTLFLLEDWRIREFLAKLAKVDAWHGASYSSDRRFEAFKDIMRGAACTAQASHDSARGPVQFVITPSGGLPLSAADPVQGRRGCGCAAMIFLCVALGSITAAFCLLL
jgi:hypothetical protein